MSVGHDDVRMIEGPFRSNTGMPMPPDEKRNEGELIKCVQVIALQVSFHYDMGLIGQLRTPNENGLLFLKRRAIRGRS